MSTLGYADPLFLLAFDHRGVFARTIFDDVPAGGPTAEQEAAMVDAKAVIFEGVRHAAEAGAAPTGHAGVLVDELYGADVARRASADGIVVVMPVEEADRDIFDFAYGDAWREHVEAFEPTFAKVLVRYNVEGDRRGNEVQAQRLADLAGWLRETGRKLLFELLVPPTAAQLGDVAGDRLGFELWRRPALMVAAMAELQDAGVEPDVWKLEGLDAVQDARAVVAQARRGEGRAGVACTVLGAGAPDDRVDGWLRVAAEVDGFTGFAIGRSIWAGAVRAYLSGEVGREDAAQEIAGKYARFVEVFTGVRAATR